MMPSRARADRRHVRQYRQRCRPAPRPSGPTSTIYLRRCSDASRATQPSSRAQDHFGWRAPRRHDHTSARRRRSLGRLASMTLREGASEVSGCRHGVGVRTNSSAGAGHLERHHDAVDAHLWGRAAVPFVAGLFARGPEFKREYPQRLPPDLRFLPGSSGDKATGARLIDFQVLLAPILAARWTIVHFSSNAEIVTSDRGYALTATPLGELPSYVIPISRRSALVVTPRRFGSPLRWTGAEWVADLAHVDAMDREVEALNRAMSAFGRDAVFGPTQRAVRVAATHLGAADRVTAGLFETIDPLPVTSTITFGWLLR